MTFQNSICRMCLNNIEEQASQILKENLQEMLQTLLININLSVSRTSVICKTCHRKLEENYNFKKKCIFTEGRLSPFAVENVKINLNEIREQIIKSEDSEANKNVCRLCLKYADKNQILSEAEKNQFHEFFPEINLNLTNRVVLCLNCYNMLKDYLIFVTSCSQLEDQLCSYSDDKKDGNKSMLSGSGIKYSRGSTEFGDLSTIEQSEVIKSEQSEKDARKGELDIKSEAYSAEEKLLYSNLGSSCKQQPDNISVENQGLPLADLEDMDTIDSESFPAEDCNSEQNFAIVANNTCPKTKVYKCETCHFETKWLKSFKRHTILKHTDPSETQMYKCVQCDHESKLKEDLKRHMLLKHTDPSVAKIYKCDKCDYNCKYSYSLERHILAMHTDVSEVAVYKCESCDYVTKFVNCIKQHVLVKHTDPSEVRMYECEECDFKSKRKRNLKNHIQSRHTDPSEMKMLKCDVCDFQCKWFNSMKEHVINKHTDPHKVKMFKCDRCVYESKYRSNLKAHIRRRHSVKK